MPAPWRRGGQDRVDYIIVERDGVDEGQAAGIKFENPTPTVHRIVRRSYTRRQVPSPTDDLDYDSDDDIETTSATTGALTIPTATSGTPPLLLTKTTPNSVPTGGAFAEQSPFETITVSLQPPSKPPHRDREGRISQTTEHLLIAAGSIGATIIIVMIILALYTMRKRGLSFSDVIKNGKNTVRRRGAPTPPPKFGMDNKQAYDDDYMYAGKDAYPARAAINSRSGSLSTTTPLQPLARSDSFKQPTLERKNSNNRSFLLDDAPSHQNSHRRGPSATPSSPILPIQDTRRSVSTRNTRSLSGDEESTLNYSDPPPRQPSSQSALPAPPTFRQFLSNRPSISQRPGLGGAMMSRFSWTNSNAPQTPHDPTRDTVSQPSLGRDSFMTSRSSVPRFRTIDSWVNQQSNRVEEQRLKQQFRMTSSTTYSDGEDTVPEMPAVPKELVQVSVRKSGLPGKDVKHQRHDTIETAPIFKQHPGTEVRFSTRSTVPSEVLDMGRRNVAL